MSTVLSWVLEQGLKKGAKALGPVYGPMIMFGEQAIKTIDKQFTKQDVEALAKARGRNGDCGHILLAYSSQTFSEGAPGEANAGDRQKTQTIGKRFKYSDMSYLFWHPSVEFLPAGNVSEVYVGSAEKVPAPPKASELRATPPVVGKLTCPWCRDDGREIGRQIKKYDQWQNSK